MLFLPFSFPIHMACRRSYDYHVTCLWVWFTLYGGFKPVCEVLESYWSAHVCYTKLWFLYMTRALTPLSRNYTEASNFDNDDFHADYYPTQ